MNTFNNIITSPDLDVIGHIVKYFFTLLYTLYIYIKIINIKTVNKKKIVISILGIIIVSFIAAIIQNKLNTYCSIIFQICMISLLNSILFKNDTIINTIVALGISYTLFVISIIISFIPNVIFGINNDYINLLILSVIYGIVVCMFFKIKKINKGLIFLQKKLENENIRIILLNISMVILVAVMSLSSGMIDRNFAITILIFIIAMFITIQKSLQLYYKQAMLIKDYEETKKELEESKNEISRLEEENLNFSKTSHSLAHKQKALEFKLNQIMLNSEVAQEIGIIDEVKELSKDIYSNPVEIELSSTGIENIDNMLKYQQAESIKNNIEFELQLNGNIYHMINNLITKEDLEILIADHVKDAIIAINHSENINRSILLRLGLIDGIYSLYIYDSGVEFSNEILENLGKKPITAYKDEGGTGMGFMNTFDTLKKYNASLIIEEIGAPCKENYTKVIKIKFDDKNNFKVISYKNNKNDKINIRSDINE